MNGISKQYVTHLTEDSVRSIEFSLSAHLAEVPNVDQDQFEKSTLVSDKFLMEGFAFSKDVVKLCPDRCISLPFREVLIKSEVK